MKIKLQAKTEAKLAKAKRLRPKAQEKRNLGRQRLLLAILHRFERIYYNTRQDCLGLCRKTWRKIPELRDHADTKLSTTTFQSSHESSQVSLCRHV